MRDGPPLRGSRSSPVGILVVDDAPAFREAVREVIDPMPDFALLAEAVSGDEAVALSRDEAPELVLVDARMRGMEGIAIARRLHEARPEAVVVLVAVDDVLGLPAEVGFCGAADVVRKQEVCAPLLRQLWGLHGDR